MSVPKSHMANMYPLDLSRVQKRLGLVDLFQAKDGECFKLVHISQIYLLLLLLHL
jgi:hypothetical protein